MEPLREQLLEISGARINYVRCGTGSPLVFLHNGGGFWQSWEKQVRYFSQTHDCIAFDWPGFGKSTQQGETAITLDFYTRCLHEVLKQLGVSHTSLIGNCIGASVAIQYKQLYPQRVNKLIVQNICPGRRIFPNTFTAKLIGAVSKKKLLRRAGINVFAFLLPRPPMKNKSPRILFGKNYNAADPLVEMYNVAFARPAISHSRAVMLFDVDSFTLADFLRPGFDNGNVTLLWGKENNVAGFEKEGRYHQQLLGLATMLPVESGGHLCMYECPESVNETITAILHK
jgi:pimeloyl-ACP methyl ester carboxylesterase